MTAAARLVNTLTPGWAHGRPWLLPGTSAGRRQVVDEVAPAGAGMRSRLDSAGVEAVFGLAARLRPVFERADRGDLDGAATGINDLLREHRVNPELTRHDGEPWHLHFHSAEVGRAAALGSACAMALAVVLGSGHLDRLGICNAAQCDRVYVDLSRNGSRRFCSETCMNRAKMAAFRARRPGGVPAG